jgi:uncharacterized NAD(P)/FAD-binding protein YdhS
MISNRHVVVAGGGASGVVLASALVRRGSSVTIIEPRERLGAGVAYSTTCPWHLLNAPASNMSAIEDEPDDFVAWLARNDEDASGSSFARRDLYGRYLDDLVTVIRETAGARFVHHRGTAVDCTPGSNGVIVTDAEGTALNADAFVIAVGNAEPAPWPAINDTVSSSPRFFSSAWAPGAIESHDHAETVVLFGTGLTAIDAALGLRYNGHRGPIVMISRRGLLPHEHRTFDTPPAAAPDAENVRDVIRAFRGTQAARSERGWRDAVDSIRSQTNIRWRALSLDDQRRLVRHALPYWNVHRHRIAPAAAKTIAELIAANDLRMIAGRTEAIEAGDDALRVRVRLRGTHDIETITAGRAINCSGPQNNFAKLPNPLIRRLIERGTLVPNPLEIGATIAPNGALVDANGTTSEQIYSIGPVRYGTLIETTAIPEIRAQAYDLALTLSGSSAPSMTPGTR